MPKKRRYQSETAIRDAQKHYRGHSRRAPKEREAYGVPGRWVLLVTEPAQTPRKERNGNA